ncbi:O-antigen ligase family protein [Candidatus Uhrbacteria bacterium]|nr:O-antigen ligase family protein [Candidatus Uhrbacteria bacterium]
MTAILLLILVCYAVIAWRKLEWGIYSILLLLPTYLIRFSAVSIPTTFLEVLILIAISIFTIKKRNEIVDFFKILWSEKGLRRALWIAADALIISATASVFVSENRLAALGIWKAYFIEPALFAILLVSVIKTKEQITKACVALAVCAVSIALVALWQKMVGIGVPGHVPADIRVTSVYGYPNAVGLFLGPIVLLWYATLESFLTRYQAGIKRALLIALGIFTTVLLFAAMAASESTAALLATAAASFFFFFFLHMRTRRLAITAALALVVVVFVSPPLLDKLQERVSLQDWSGHVRKVTWTESVQMLQNNWLTGAGLAGYKAAMEPYHKATYLEIFLYPHNSVLNVWSETGLYGLLSFSVFIAVLFIMLVRASMRYARAQKKVEYAISLALLAVLIQMGIQGLVDVPYFKNDLSVLFWAVVALSYIIYSNSLKVDPALTLEKSNLVRT